MVLLLSTEMSGATVVGCAVLLEMPELRGRKRLSWPLFVLAPDGDDAAGSAGGGAAAKQVSAKK